MGRSQVWLWSEVNRWLALHELDDGAIYPTRREMSEIDVAIAASISVTFDFTSADIQGFELGRSKVIEELTKNHISGIAQFLASLERARNSRGAHVLVVADQGEPARDVMSHVASFDHDVILVTETAEQFMATVLSTRLRSRPTKIVAVPRVATVGDWMRLVQDNPQAAFTLRDEMDAGEEVARIQRRLAIAA